MSLSVCVSDKSVPAASALSSLLINRSHSVALLSPPGSGALSELPWNRSSVLSAETVPLEMKSRFGSFDALLMCFDAAAISRRSGDASSGGSDRLVLAQGIDEYIRGCALLASSCADCMKAQGFGRLVFALAQPLKNEQRPADRANGSCLAASLAESSFKRLAEEYAGLCAEHQAWAGVNVLLITYDAETESEAFEHIASFLESAPGKNQTLRSGVRWVKAGSRGLFGLR